MAYGAHLKPFLLIHGKQIDSHIDCRKNMLESLSWHLTLDSVQSQTVENCLLQPTPISHGWIEIRNSETTMNWRRQMNKFGGER